MTDIIQVSGGASYDETMAVVRQLVAKAHEEREKELVQEYIDGSNAAGLPPVSGQETPDFGAEVAGEFDYLLERFAGFFDQQVSSLDAMFHELQAAGGSFGFMPIEEVTSLGTFMNTWQGSAAVGFRENFAKPFREAVANQRGCLTELMQGLISTKNLIGRTRDDVKAIAEGVLKNLNELHAGDPTGWDRTLALVGALTTIGLAAPVLIAVETGAFIVTLTLVSVTSSGVPVVTTSVGGKGFTVQQIITQLDTALNAVENAVLEQEEALRTALTATLKSIEDGLRSPDAAKYVRPDRPAFADRSGRDERKEFEFPPGRGFIYDGQRT